ncbi:hypothetical protein QTP88_002785 [Uroleucon formosanum]
MDHFEWIHMSNSNINDEEFHNFILCLSDIRVNKYMDMITKHSPNTLYAFNTHFFTALYINGFSRIHRWTKNIDIFSKERLFIPIYFKSNLMWGLIYVNFGDKSIRFYDSHGHGGMRYQKLILKYLKLEYLMKKGKFFCTADWKFTNLNNLDDGFKRWDSGLFMCFIAHHFALNLSADATLPFSSEGVGGEKTVREKIETELKNNFISIS